MPPDTDGFVGGSRLYNLGDQKAAEVLVTLSSG